MFKYVHQSFRFDQDFVGLPVKGVLYSAITVVSTDNDKNKMPNFRSFFLLATKTALYNLNFLMNLQQLNG